MYVEDRYDHTNTNWVQIMGAFYSLKKNKKKDNGFRKFVINFMKVFMMTI